VPNKFIFKIVKFIAKSLNSRMRERMATRRLPVAYHWLDERRDQISDELLRKAFVAAEAKNITQITGC
jgi:hypothetical protein